MNSNPFFRIRNLSRVFDMKLVLYVPKLDTPQGKEVICRAIRR